MTPQAGVTLPIGSRGIERAQRAAGVNDLSRQALVKVSLAGGEVKVPELDLAVRPSHLESTGHAMAIMVMISQSQGLLPGFSHCRRECDAHRRPGCHADTAAQAEDGIEHRA